MADFARGPMLFREGQFEYSPRCHIRARVAHGSDPTQPTSCADPTQPNPLQVKKIGPDPTRPDPMQLTLEITV